MIDGARKNKQLSCRKKKYITLFKGFSDGLDSGGSVIKNLLAMWETWVQSLGWEDPVEEGMAIRSSILA